MNNKVYKILVIINIFLAMISLFVPMNPISLSTMAIFGWVCCLIEIISNNNNKKNN